MSQNNNQQVDGVGGSPSLSVHNNKQQKDGVGDILTKFCQEENKAIGDMEQQVDLTGE